MEKTKIRIKYQFRAKNKKMIFLSETNIGPQFHFTGSWPKKSNFEGSKYLVAPHACIRMVNIGRLLLDTNFKKILSIGEYSRLIVLYWEASQNLRGAVNPAL